MLLLGLVDSSCTSLPVRRMAVMLGVKTFAGVRNSPAVKFHPKAQVLTVACHKKAEFPCSASFPQDQIGVRLGSNPISTLAQPPFPQDQIGIRLGSSPFINPCSASISTRSDLGQVGVKPYINARDAQIVVNPYVNPQPCGNP